MNRRDFLVRSVAGLWLAGEAARELERDFKRSLWTGWSHTLHGDGIHDDTAALQAALDGKRVWSVSDNDYIVRANGMLRLHHGNYRVSSTLDVPSDTFIHDCSFYGEKKASPIVRLTGQRIAMVGNLLDTPGGTAMEFGSIDSGSMIPPSAVAFNLALLKTRFGTNWRVI